MLNQTGLGNHPEVVRFCAKAGRAVSEDKVVTGGNQHQFTPTQPRVARLYPSSKE
jgi:hypothetical protein